MTKLLQQPFFITFILSLGVLIFIICSYVFGWTLPSSTAPNNNLSSPLNTSSNNQYKLGYLAVGTSTVPSFPLDVAGVVRIGRYSSAPSGANGALYYDTGTNKFKGYQSGAWSDLGGGATELWTSSGTTIYYTSGKVGIGTSTPSYQVTVAPPTGSAFDISICKNGVCCPIWKDCDGDGKTYGNGDCDESCATCYVGSNSYTTSPDGKDQDCDGTVDESGNIYYIYRTSALYNGNLGSRSGADSKCNSDSNKPTDIVGNAWAFLSINSNDEVVDFPSTKSLLPELPFYWKNGASTLYMAQNFADILDGSIANTAESAGYSSGGAWTGSNSNGTLRSDNCNGFTDSSNYYGSGGVSYANDLLYYWQNWYCTNSKFLYCIVKSNGTFQVIYQ